MSGSYYTLNQKYNTLLSLLTSGTIPPYPPAADVMTTNTAQSVTAKKTFSVLPESSVVPTTNDQLVNKAYVDGLVGPTPDLQDVLDAGNSATGANAKISLTDSGAGGLANPQLTLTNSNATINTIPTIELNKTGRKLTAGESVGSISMYGLDDGTQKTEWGRIQIKAENVASGNEDGTLSIFNAVNGASLEVFNFNGGQNENNTFRPLDMNGNALRSNTGNLVLEATNSVGTGNINLTAKTGAVINLNSGAKTDSSIQTLTGSGGSKIDFAGGSADDRFDIDNDAINLHWNNLTDQADISLLNDYATTNSAIDMYYQSPSGNIQTIIQNIPTIQRLQQIDSINARQAELSPAKLQLTNSANGTTMILDNNFATYENKLTLSGADTTTATYTLAEIVNRPSNQLIQLSANLGTSNSKTLTLINETTTSSSLTFNNQLDANPFNITSNQDLNISSTKAGGLIDMTSASNIDITATGDNLTLTAGATMLLDSDDLQFTNSNITTTTPNHTSSLATTSNIANITTYLKVKLNNADIWIPYFTVDPNV
jgi:hypothetical protein